MTPSIIAYWASKGISVGLQPTEPPPAKPPVARKPPTRKPLADRFRKYFQVGAPDQCWLWQGACRGSFNGGYGVIGLGGKGARLVAAHRMAYELANGPVPEGKNVYHTCLTTTCVNPAHLVAQTVSENMKDGYKRGTRIPPQTIIKGRI